MMRPVVASSTNIQGFSGRNLDFSVNCLVVCLGAERFAEVTALQHHLQRSAMGRWAVCAAELGMYGMYGMQTWRVGLGRHPLPRTRKEPMNFFNYLVAGKRLDQYQAKIFGKSLTGKWSQKSSFFWIPWTIFVTWKAPKHQKSTMEKEHLYNFSCAALEGFFRIFGTCQGGSLNPPLPPTSKPKSFPFIHGQSTAFPKAPSPSSFSARHPFEQIKAISPIRTLKNNAQKEAHPSATKAKHCTLSPSRRNQTLKKHHCLPQIQILQKCA